MLRRQDKQGLPEDQGGKRKVYHRIVRERVIYSDEREKTATLGGDNSVKVADQKSSRVQTQEKHKVTSRDFCNEQLTIGAGRRVKGVFLLVFGNNGKEKGPVGVGKRNGEKSKNARSPRLGGKREEVRGSQSVQGVKEGKRKKRHQSVKLDRGQGWGGN